MPEFWCKLSKYSMGATTSEGSGHGSAEATPVRGLEHLRRYTLFDLDTRVTSANDGEVLSYNSDTNCWISTTIAALSGTGSPIIGKPVGTITARVGDTPGTGTMTQYTFDGDDLVAGDAISVVNLAGVTISGDVFILGITHSSGKVIVIFEDCS